MARIALRKTANENKAEYPKAAEVLEKSTYMDDICESVDTKQEARELTDNIDKVLKTRGFSVKEWICNETLKEKDNNTKGKVLGTMWNFKTDKFHFRVAADLLKLENSSSQVAMKMTKRKILSQVARMYNPIGFAAAFILRAKIQQQKGFYSEDQFQIVKAFKDGFVYVQKEMWKHRGKLTCGMAYQKV